MAEVADDPVLVPLRIPHRTPQTQAFKVRDIFRDRATVGKFAAVIGLHMGQVFPAAFFGLMLTAIYREKGLPLDLFWIFMLPSVPTWLRPLRAPLVDGVGSSRIGLRNTWFIPCALFGAAAYLSVAGTVRAADRDAEDHQRDDRRHF